MSHNILLLLTLFLISPLISTVGLTDLLLNILTVDPADVASASVDFGGTTTSPPLAVLRPNNAQDISNLIRAAYSSSVSFTVSARGHGHSINGQANAKDGIVISMTGGGPHPRTKPVCNNYERECYVDVWGGELWIDVLRWTLSNGGLAPKSWTDYLYLSVGGTLSNAGISGQAFQHGPQISNVHELDVVTGKGDIVTCSERENRKLFFAVLGGLGQFGVITRARIALEPSPERVRWIRVLYSNFTAFTNDQEYLTRGLPKFDYVEGFVIVDEGLINNWRSSFFSPKNPIKMSSVNANGGVLYCLEVTKNYNHLTEASLDNEIETLLKELDFIPETVFTTDMPYVDFLDRVHRAEGKLRAKGLWDVPHPWLNLFVPASRIADFDRGVFKGILGNKTSGPILIYPMNKNKWNERSSVVTLNEDVFYLVAFLRTAVPDTQDPARSLEYLVDQNERILRFCEEAKIGIKQYLPNYERRSAWEGHFGKYWGRFLRRKAEFDPRGILGTGQRIFRPLSSPYSDPLSSL